MEQFKFNTVFPQCLQVRLCVDPSTLKPMDCSELGRERRLTAGPASSACPTGPGATIGFPKYRSAGAGGVPWGLLLGFAATAALVLLALAALQNFLYSKGVIPVCSCKFYCMLRLLPSEASPRKKRYPGMWLSLFFFKFFWFSLPGGAGQKKAVSWYVAAILLAPVSLSVISLGGGLNKKT